MSGSVEASVCSVGQEGGWLGVRDLNDCDPQVPVALALEISQKNSLFFGANYPGFSGYENYIDELGELNRQALDQLLADARMLAPLVTAQYKLANAWSDQTPRFELGGQVEDTSGPFVLGVNVANLPNETIYEELVEVPNHGILYQVNDRPIYSVADVHEALTAHGDSAGIKELLDLSIYSRAPAVMDAAYRTRYRFRTQATQNFNTNISDLDLAVHGFIPWTNLRCVGATHCAWVKDQEYAYARQIDPHRFKTITVTGELVGSIAIPFASLKLFKWANRGRHLSVLSRISLGGMSEGATEFGYEWAKQPPSVDSATRFQAAEGSAKTGFLFGAAFGWFAR